MRTRGIATRRGDAETVRKAREAHDQALHTRGGDDPVATSPETQKKKRRCINFPHAPGFLPPLAAAHRGDGRQEDISPGLSRSRASRERRGPASRDVHRARHPSDVGHTPTRLPTVRGGLS